MAEELLPTPPAADGQLPLLVFGASLAAIAISTVLLCSGSKKKAVPANEDDAAIPSCGTQKATETADAVKAAKKKQRPNSAQRAEAKAAAELVAAEKAKAEAEARAEAEAKAAAAAAAKAAAEEAAYEAELAAQAGSAGRRRPAPNRT